MGVSWRVKTGICPSLEIGTKNQNFLENLKSTAQFRLIDLFLAMTSGVSMQSGAHVKVKMCALSNNLNVKYREKFYER